mgnify:CR=1 FL=1
MEAFFTRPAIRRLARIRLICILRNDRWFGVVLGGVALLLLGIIALIPKVWEMAPPGMNTSIRVSTLDLAQVWALQRKARQATQAGDFKAASFAWLAACANNRGDPGSIRGFLNNFLMSNAPTEHFETAIRASLWLLRLTATNQSDLVITCDVLARCGADSLAIPLLAPLASELSPTLEAHYLKALYHRENAVEFERLWEREVNGRATSSELELYHATVQAGWGEPNERTAGLTLLDQASRNGPHRELALRLSMDASTRDSDLARYSASLQQVIERGLDSHSDHIRYWQLLIEHNRRKEALELMERSIKQPGNTADVLSLARLWSRLGRHDKAIQGLASASPVAGASLDYWKYYADLLIDTQNWGELRRVSLQMRRRRGFHPELQPLAHYLEGRAALGENRGLSASQAFGRMLEWPFESQATLLAVAAQLLDLNQPQWSLNILNRWKGPKPEAPAYWSLLFQSARGAGDADGMLTAATEWNLLEPNNPEAMQNYAAALLIHRTKGAEAVRLTWLLRSWVPNSQPAAINHAAALNLVGRYTESETLFSQMATNRLTQSQRAVVQLNRLALDLQFNHLEDAQARIKTIHPSVLYAPQRDWLSQLKRETASKRGEIQRRNAVRN